MSYEYERVATPAGGLRLHLNENTAGCSPAVVEAVRALTPVQLAEYPDYDAALGATARRLGVSQDSVQLHGGMGMSDEVKVSHTFRRLTVIAQQFGDAEHHLERFAA